LAHVYCDQTVGWIKLTFSMEVGLGPGDIVLDGDPPLPPEKRHSPQFPAHVYYGQTAVCIRILLGTEVGLRGDTVLDGNPAPLL